MTIGYVDAVKGGVISVIFFSCLAFFVQGQGNAEDIKLILTVTTFLFAILSGFFIARAGSRFNEIRSAVSKEDALFLSFYKTAQVQGEKFSGKIRSLIDKYYIISYDNWLAIYGDTGYKKTLPCFLQIWDEVISLKPKAPHAYERLLDTLTDIEESRNIASSIAKEVVNRGQWVLLSMLSIIILFCLFSLKTNDIFSMTITVLLSSALIIILLLLRDLQNLRFGGEKELLVESGQEVFESIGLLRYYNNKFFQENHYVVPENIKEFRLGFHSQGEKFNIKIIKNSPD